MRLGDSPLLSNGPPACPRTQTGLSAWPTPIHLALQGPCPRSGSAQFSSRYSPWHVYIKYMYEAWPWFVRPGPNPARPHDTCASCMVLQWTCLLPSNSEPAHLLLLLWACGLYLLVYCFGFEIISREKKTKSLPFCPFGILFMSDIRRLEMVWALWPKVLTLTQQAKVVISALLVPFLLFRLLACLQLSEFFLLAYTPVSPSKFSLYLIS